MQFLSENVYLFLVVRSDSEDLSPGEFSPRAPVHSTAKKSSVGARMPKEPTGLARAFDLGESLNLLPE